MHNFGYSEEGHPGSMGDARLWRRILGYCRGHAPALAGAVLLSLIITVASLALPRLMQTGIDTAIVAEGIGRPERLAALGRTALSYGLLVGVVFLTTFLQVVVLEWIGQSIMHRLRQHLFTHLLTLDLHYFHSQPAGRLVTRLTNDIENMHEMFTSVMVTLFNDGLKLVGIFWFLFLMNGPLALVMAIFIPLATISTMVFSRFAREKFRAIRSQLARINSFLAESLAGVAVIQSFGGQERSSRTHDGLTQEYLVRSFGQIKVFGLFMPLIDLMSSAAIALIIWYGGGEVIRNHLTIGQLAAFVSYMRLFFQPLRELSQKYSIVQAAMASAERIFQTLDTRSALPAPTRPIAAAPVPVAGAIEFKGIEFGYEPGRPILHGIDLRIDPGETVALVGATGAGKSTLISLLVRFYDPVTGQVLIDGEDVRDLPLSILRQRVGLIMQDIFILPDTVRANIVLDREPDEQRLAAILDRTGLQAFVDRLPQGLSTRIGEGALNLSLGEKQLLSFVRALYRDPAILVLDEATASIDTESENMLEQAIAAGFRGRTSLVIAHRLSTIRRVDRIVVLDQGQIVEQGSHDQLMARESVYRGLVRLDGE
ncbi:MAG: ABC transporter ATP-binding protein/permease [Desulfobulbus sp.]|jgi:ATP-binding cassette subfamily B protein|uniref:ABC transporter ATP-binding protein n=1 Tax=Desulfobulbus sp. TaxID=895 RepID=UPI002848139B|nr:ABC transporter ATP-binding protein [Desulfobulbus sp.]MDR2550897.1 ABC transporter ATP-binding protein/permease [Desulfobulbus sp.]